MQPEASGHDEVENPAPTIVVRRSFGSISKDDDSGAHLELHRGLLQGDRSALIGVEQHPPRFRPVVGQHEAGNSATAAQVEGPSR